MFRNIKALKRLGYLYPLHKRRHFELINDLFSGARSPADAAALLGARLHAHKQLDLHTIILSDEDICMRRNLEVLAGFRKFFDVKVVFTLRRQDLWLESWYLQNVKWQWVPHLSHCSFDGFMAHQDDFHWIHYDRYVQHLEQLFGPENVILNIHEKQQMPDGPLEAFCRSIGLQPSAEFVQPAKVNPSFSPLMSEFMRCLPLDAAGQDYRRVLTRACAEADRALQPEGPQSSLLMPHAQRQQVMAQFAAGNRALAQRRFGRDALFLEPLPGPEAPLAQRQLPQDPYVLMEQFVAPLLSGVISHQQKSGGKG